MIDILCGLVNDIVFIIKKYLVDFGSMLLKFKEIVFVNYSYFLEGSIEKWYSSYFF